MTTLRNELKKRGQEYDSCLGRRAEDIYFNDSIELCESLGYIVSHIRRLDFEIPEDEPQSNNSYAISNGITSGGNIMKYSREYRIYFDTKIRMPQRLKNRLQNDNQNRITGSLFIEACVELGFVSGSIQDQAELKKTIENVFSDQNEIKAFRHGLSL